MNIEKNQIDELNAILKVKLEPADYEQQYQKALKEYSKKARIPGFRPGKVPVHMIKKMVGTLLLVEEINKILNREIDNYIKENNLQVLGFPLPKQNEKPIDWEKDQEFEFEYEIGLSPDIDPDPSKVKVTKYVAEITDELVQKKIEELRKRYGKVSTPETPGDEDILYGNAEECDENGNIVEGGVHHKTTILINQVKDDELKSKIRTIKQGESFVFNPHQIWSREEIAERFHIMPEKADEITRMKYTVERINHLEPAELNQEFFDKIYGKDSVKSEEEFIQRLKEDMQKGLNSDIRYLFHQNIQKALMEHYNFDLPDEFMKKWIKAVNEKPITDEQLEKEYPEYSKQLKWDIIETKLIEKYNLSAEFNEIEEYVKSLVIDYYYSKGIPLPADEELKQMVFKVLSNRDELNKYYKDVLRIKLFEKLENEVNIKEVNVTYDEFLKKLYGEE